MHELVGQPWWGEFLDDLKTLRLSGLAAKFGVSEDALVEALVVASAGLGASASLWWPEAVRRVRAGQSLRGVARVFDTNPRRLRRALAREGVRSGGASIQADGVPELLAVRDRLGKVPDSDLAAEAGVTVDAVKGERRRLGVAPYRPPSPEAKPKPVVRPVAASPPPVRDPAPKARPARDKPSRGDRPSGPRNGGGRFDKRGAGRRSVVVPEVIRRSSRSAGAPPPLPRQGLRRLSDPPAEPSFTAESSKTGSSTPESGGRRDEGGPVVVRRRRRIVRRDPVEAARAAMREEEAAAPRPRVRTRKDVLHGAVRVVDVADVDLTDVVDDAGADAPAVDGVGTLPLAVEAAVAPVVAATAPVVVPDDATVDPTPAVARPVVAPRVAADVADTVSALSILAPAPSTPTPVAMPPAPPPVTTIPSPTPAPVPAVTRTTPAAASQQPAREIAHRRADETGVRKMGSRAWRAAVDGQTLPLLIVADEFGEAVQKLAGLVEPHELARASVWQAGSLIESKRG